VTVDLIPWAAPGPYRVAFSTRVGGVSEGQYGSLNIGALTADAPAAPPENRRRLLEALGADPERATMARQVHGARVLPARPTGVVTPGEAGAGAYDECDGLWTAEPGQGLLLVTADCVPIALVRTEPAAADTAAAEAADRPGHGGTPSSGPALALLHAGWRGLLAGVVEQGVRALGGGPHPGAARLAAAIGPCIGPCCFEVGDEVAVPFREAFGKDSVRDGRADLPLAVERALHGAGVTRIHRTDLCTACNPQLFFSHRRDAGLTGRQGVVGVIG